MKKKKREEEKLCSLSKCETNVRKHFMFGVNAVWPYVMCREMVGKIQYTQKRHY